MKEIWANSLVVRLRIRTSFELIASTLPPHHLSGQGAAPCPSLDVAQEICVWLLLS